MTPEAQFDLVSLLEESRQKMNEAVAGLAEADAARTPETGGWSVLGCVEHVAFVEGRFLGRLAVAEKWDTPQPCRIAELLQKGADRSKRIAAPEVIHPAGRYATLAEALATFNETRAKTIETVAARAAELPMLKMQHPLFGWMTAEDLVALVAAHASRHAVQVREIRAGL